MHFHNHDFFFSLSAFDLGLTFNELLSFLSALFIVVLPLKDLSAKDLIVRNFLKSYTYLLDSHIKSFLLICSSNFLISIISLLISLLSKTLEKIILIDCGFCWHYTAFKTFKALTCFFSFIFNYFYLFFKIFSQRIIIKISLFNYSTLMERKYFFL